MAGDTPLLLTESNLQALINKIRSDYTDPLSYVKECIHSGTSIVPVTIQNHQVSDYEFLILKVGAGTERRFFTLPVNTDTTTIEIIGRNTSSSGLITLSDGVVNISHANVTIDKLSNSVAVVPTTWTSADFKCTLMEVYGMRAVREASSPYFFPTMADIMLAAHPVHSLYISKDPTDPGELFGGTWQRIKDCMLWAAGDSDTVATNVFTSEGGNTSVTIGCGNLPDHHHAFAGTQTTTNWSILDTSFNIRHWESGSEVTDNSRSNKIHNGSSWVTESTGADGFYTTSGGGSESRQENDDSSDNSTMDKVRLYYEHRHYYTAAGKATGIRNTSDATFTQSALNIMNPHNKVYVWQRTA